MPQNLSTPSRSGRGALSALVGVLLGSASLPAFAQVQGEIGEYSNATIENSVLEPSPIIVSDDAELASLITVPEGFTVEVVARDLINPRMIAVASDGTVYITRRSVGDVIKLEDRDGDGRYEDVVPVASRPGLHGIAIDGGQVFLAAVNDVFTAPINEDGTFGTLNRIMEDLPDGGQHQNRTLGIGPDGMLYITVGSTCNECDESSPESATILRASLDGKSRSIFASGLRNTIGFGWEPTTGVLYGADHGIDWLGDEEQVEELNAIEQGKQYGWPVIYGMSEVNPHFNPPEGITLEQWAERSEEPVLGYTPHSAPMQMAFYTGNAFPDDYQGDAFIAMRGSWNRNPPSGYEVARVDFEDGQPISIEPFATGFLIEGEGEPGFGFLGRLAGVAMTPDGGLLVSDDTNGVLYRISHEGTTETADASPTSADVPDVVPPAPETNNAIDMVEPSTDTPLTVTAGTFENAAMMPIAHSADGHNASPMLEWSDVPEGTQSFVVIMDDPDAASPKPFTHWIAFDIPGTTTSLHEGIAPDLLVPDVTGMKQGTGSVGAPGYFGPKTPVGDPAHRYLFQVFALDLPALPVDPGATRDMVVAAMQGHVLAEGVTIGMFQRPAPELPAN